MKNDIPSLPSSWSQLTWKQLCLVWDVKRRYGGNADSARAAALLVLACGEGITVNFLKTDDHTSEPVYQLTCQDGTAYTVTPRELSYMASKALPWLDYPYGDQGEKQERDEHGKLVKEEREGVRGLVNQDLANWHDALSLQEETVTVDGYVFSLPQVALFNLTWHQYRTLQSIAPQLFSEDVDDKQARDIQALWLAYSLVPEDSAQNGVSHDPFRPAHLFRYREDRAETTVPFWRRQLEKPDGNALTLFNISFQVYQTAMANYYPIVYPLLFSEGGKTDPLHTALTGETDTINAVMKYEGYSSPQEVYDANLPIVFSVLNTMAKEARQVEEMNKKIRSKK